MALLRCEKHNTTYSSTSHCQFCEEDIETKIKTLEGKLAALNQITQNDRMFDFNIKKSHEIKSNKADQKRPHGTLPKGFPEPTIPKETPSTLPKGFYKTKQIKKPKKPSLINQILLALEIAEKKNA